MLIYIFIRYKRKPRSKEKTADKQKYIVRHYDGIDNIWHDVCEPVSKNAAERIYNEKTEQGTRNIDFDDIDYYKIFPADTKMKYSEKGIYKDGRSLGKFYPSEDITNY